MPSIFRKSATQTSTVPITVLVILRPKDSRKERYVVLIEQPRVGSRSGKGTLELPAAIRDHSSGKISGTAMEKICQDMCVSPRIEELIDLTTMALGRSQVDRYQIPAHLNEHSPCLLWEKFLDRKEIEDFKGRLTNQRTHGKSITIRVYDYETLWREASENPTTMNAWTLYEGLRATGSIDERSNDIRAGTTKRS
jgi:ADP-sugar diphosphatase